MLQYSIKHTFGDSVFPRFHPPFSSITPLFFKQTSFFPYLHRPSPSLALYFFSINDDKLRDSSEANRQMSKE